MSLIKKLNEEIVMWDKMEGAGAVFWMYGWGKKKQKDPEAKSEGLTLDQAYKAYRNKIPVKKWDGKVGIITNIREDYYKGIAVVEIKYPYGVYGAELICDLEFADSPNESEDDDYRDDTQGNRNAKYLKKARIHANTPQARLKRERTELKKELDGES